MYINSEYGCAWKYPGERDLYRLPEEFDIGKEVDNSDLEEDGYEVYSVVISVNEIEKMEKLALELGNNMHYKEPRIAQYSQRRVAKRYRKAIIRLEK